MANDDKKIRIKIETEADTKAIKDTDDALQNLNTTAAQPDGLADSIAARNIQHQTEKSMVDDVAEARARAADRAEQASQKDIMAMAGRTAAYVASAKAISETSEYAGRWTQGLIDDLRKVSPEAAAAHEDLEKLATFMQNPVSESMNWFMNWAAGDPKKAIDELAVSLERAAGARQKLLTTIIESGEREISALEAQAQMLKVAAAIASAGAAAGVAEAKRGDAADLASGGIDRTAVEVKNALRALDAAVAQLAAEPQQIQQQIDQITEEARALRQDAKTIADEVGKDSPEYSRLQGKIEEREGKLAELGKQLEISNATMSDRQRELAATHGQEIDAAMADHGSSLTETAAKLRDSLASAAQEVGGLDTDASAALKMLTEKLQDGVIKPNEVADVVNAIGRLGNSSAEYHNEVRGALAAAANAIAGYKSSISEITRRLGSLEYESRNIRAALGR